MRVSGRAGLPGERVPREGNSETSAKMAVQVSFRDRFVAWWEGYDSQARLKPDADDRESEEESAEQGAGHSSLHALRERVKAWWAGDRNQKEPLPEDEPAPPEPGPQAARKPPEQGPEQETEIETWSAARIEVAERIWGAGFTSPGGADHVLKLVEPLNLKPGMRVLHFGAGLGGPARAMAGALGVKVTGLEPAQALATRGMEESIDAGMAESAPVLAGDLESLGLGDKRFDCVFAKEALFTVADKRRLLGALAERLKTGGELLFTDYLLADGARAGPEVEDWVAHEPVRPEPWSLNQVRACLEELEFEVRSEDDVSEEFSGQVLAAWHGLLSSLAPSPLGPELGQALLDEAEMWLHRMAVLASGAVRITRVHAVKR